MWSRAEDVEISQLDEYEAFEDLGPDAKIPDEYQLIMVHFVYDYKHDGRAKGRLVANGNLTETPVESVYLGVVSC